MISKAVRTAAGMRWAILFALVLLVATAVPVLAESSPELPDEAAIAQIPAPTPAEIATAESAQREHEEWLLTAEAVQQREASQTAYDNLTASESRALLVESFPVQLQELNADPARVISGLEIDKSLGEYAARVIDEDGEKSIIESSAPVESSLGGNGVEPVDLALESADDGFVSENPLTKVRLPASADGAIQLEGGVSVQLPASVDHSAVPLGDEDLFYPETEPTTDTLVSTRASGVEVFEQLRSPESPEEFSFDLELPVGASLGENSKGGAEVIDGTGATITEVLPPTAVDAQGVAVPVTMSVEGQSLLLDVPHRNGDFAAPILVDPVFINYGASLTETTNFSSSLWPSSTSGGGYVNRNFGNGLNVYSQGSSTSLGANTHGQFAYSAPGSTAWIAAATFSELSFFPVGTCRKDEPHGYVGIYNPGSGSYASFGEYRNGTITGASFNTGEAGNTGTRWAIFGLGTSGEGFTMNCVHEFWMGGYSIKEKDWDAPTFTSTPSVPSGWFDSSGLSESTIAATDPGFGVHDLSVGETGGVTNHHPLGCSGAAGSRCNASASWKTPIPYKAGERTLIVTAEDPLGNVNEWTKPTKVDAQKPEIELHGQFAKATEEVGLEGEENPASENRLPLPVYNLQIKAIDGKETPATERQAGVTKMEVLLDEGKEPLAKWEGACAKGYSCSHELPFQLKLTGLADGVHHLHVRATDGVNHTEEREIDFEYIPATGEDSEYVMQHFLLVEGEEQSGDPSLAVNVMNGNLVYREQDLNLNTPSANVEVERVYNSQLPKEVSSEWGSGWTLAQTPTLEPEVSGGGGGGTATTATRRASGVITRGVTLPSESGGKKFSPTLHAMVTRTPSGTYTVTDESGEITAYDSKGLPTEVKTGEFSAINYEWEGEQLDEISVEDPAATTSSPEEVAESQGGMSEGQPVFEATFGDTGANYGEFQGPAGMALDASGDLWVVDRGNGRVEEFDAEGTYLSQIGASGSGEGQLRDPIAVAVDGGGNVWVTDSGNNRVQVFDDEGNYLKSVGSAGTGEGQFSGDGPQGIAVDGSGNAFIADAGGHRVEKFDSGGKFLESFGAVQLVEPAGLTLGPSGRIWVADPGQGKIVAFKATGQLLRSFGVQGEGDGELESPVAVAVNSSNQVFAADAANGRVVEFSEAGTFLHEFGSREEGKGRFSAPMGIAADGEGHVWVSALANSPEAEEVGEEAEPAPEEESSETPVAAYSFDEGTGTIAHDDSAGENDGILSSAQWVAGKYNSALKFNGESSCVSVPSGPELQLDQGLTLEAWVKSEGSGSDEPIIVKETPSFFSYAAYLGREESGKAEGIVSSAAWSWEETTSPEKIPSNTWTSLAFTDDGENLRLYVNGKLTDTAPAEEVQSSNGSLSIGCDALFGHHFKGLIDNVRIYDHAIGAGRLADDEATPVPPGDFSLLTPVAAYSFDEGTGTIAHDDSAGENDGILSSAQWVAGKYNSALKFNGESSCVSVPSGPELQLDQGLTLEAWVKSEGSGSDEPIIVKETPSFFSYAAYLGREESGKAEGIVSSAAWSWEETTSPEKIPSNTWTSLAFTDDGENLRLYVNGKLTDTAPAEEVQSSNGSLSIGCDALFGHHFKGLIDNVRIYDHAIGAGRLADDEATPVPPGDFSLLTPVAAYSFDEGTGTIAHDDSAGENDGAIADADWIEGRYGRALAFDGEGSCVTAADAPELQLDKDFTLEAWVQPEGSGSDEPILVKETDEFFGYALYVGREDDGKAEGIVSDEDWSWEEATSVADLPIGQWSSLAFTSDGENLRLHVNGKLVDTEPAYGAQATGGSLSIGCRQNSGHHFKGLIDNVRIYDHAIGAGRLADDEATPVPPGRRFEVERWKTTDATPIDPPEDDPRLSLSYESNLVSGIEGDQIPTQTYDHQGELLTASQGASGETNYEYDASHRLKSITLSDGTSASIAYEAELGRVASVTVQLAGKSAKTTSFEYEDEPRETIVHPPGEPVIHYQIAEDGSVFKWSNAAKPPEIELLTGSLYFQRGEVHPEPISPGDQNLEVIAHSPEGIASIQVIANGDQLVEELTCTPEGEVGCLTAELEYVTETESWTPGTLWLEVLAIDSLGNMSSERFWDNIPYVPPPEGEAPVPPTFAEIKRFREEFGLDLDLKSNPLARNERIFELINSWHRPGTYLGQVARSSWEQWGEPLRPVDVAELEYREWFFSVNAERIDQWVEETQPSSFAGYYIDHAAGGIMHVGFLGNQEEQLSNLSSNLSLVAQERLQIYSPAPTASYLSVHATSEVVRGAVESNPSLKALVVSVGVDESGKVVQVGASNVSEVEGILRGILGSSAPVSVEYEAKNGELLSGRFRNEGRMRAGDFIASRVFIEGLHLVNGACTAGFGAKEKAGEVGGSPVWRAFVLTAGHCTPKGQTVYRSTDSDKEDESNWSEVGEVKRNALEEFESIRTDAEAIRVKDGGVVPRSIFGFDGHPIATEPAEKARKGEVLCFSGTRTQVPQCGRIVHRSQAWVNRTEDHLARGGYWVTFAKGAIPGDSGAPVWKRRTRAPIGQVTAKRTHGAVAETLVEPLLHPYRMPATIVPGILGNPHMGKISLMLGGD
jgi:YD repeat-containing protein